MKVKYRLNGRNYWGKIELNLPIKSCFDCPFCNNTLEQKMERPQYIIGLRYCNLRQVSIDIDNKKPWEIGRPEWCPLSKEEIDKNGAV